MEQEEAGYREVEHTADWMLEVWALGIPELFEQAARGMYSLSGTRLQEGPRQKRSFEIEAPDEEGLLVYFLSELLYYGEKEGLAFDHFELEHQEQHLLAQVKGSTILSQEKEIKAVTYHHLKIQPSKKGLQVRIVFDV
jgi:SHS2 domain-containing protein